MTFGDTLADLSFTKGVIRTSSTHHRGIYAGSYGLFQPDLAQGSYRASGTAINNSDTAYVLSFARGAYRADTASQSSTMWHVPMRFHSFYNTATQTDNNTIASVKGILLNNPGEFAHLAARPILTNKNQYDQTRRIYQKGSTVPPVIAQTAQHFYRIGINTDEEARVISGFSGGDNYCGPLLIMPVLIDNLELRFESSEPVIDSVTLEETHPQTDTIRTNWFTIGPSAEMTAYIHATDTSVARLELVERTTMAVVVTPIPLETSTDSTLQEIKHTFINGGNSEYRLQFPRRGITIHGVIPPAVSPLATRHREQLHLPYRKSIFITTISTTGEPRLTHRSIRIRVSAGMKMTALLYGWNLIIFIMHVPTTTAKLHC
jgi:hypothetical protein